MAPSVAMRPAFLAAAASPFLRRNSAACSMLPSVSVSAFLQSDMPAPVRSRRSLIIAALISAMVLISLAAFIRGHRRFGRRTGGAAATRRDLHLGTIAARRHADG